MKHYQLIRTDLRGHIKVLKESTELEALVTLRKKKSNNTRYEYSVRPKPEEKE